MPKDFGKKIPGARKDVWKARGLLYTDLEGLGMPEKIKITTKNNIWPKPDYDKMVQEEGYEKEVVRFMKLIRDSVPTLKFPADIDPSTVDELLQSYIEYVKIIRNRTMELSNMNDVHAFWEHRLLPEIAYDIHSPYSYQIKEKYVFFYNKKIRDAARTSDTTLQGMVKEKQFGFTNEEKILSRYTFYTYDSKHIVMNDESKKYNLSYRTGFSISNFTDVGIHSEEELKQSYQEGTILVLDSNRKVIRKNIPTIEEAKQWVLAMEKLAEEVMKKLPTSTKKKKRKYKHPYLSDLRREGPVVRAKNAHATDKEFLNIFQLVGGEFGNWVDEKEGSINMDYAYDAFLDLAHILNIDVKDISLGNNLAIAWGSRGRGKSTGVAHYEPDNQIINLTKLKGAGSLAHEWIHAFDDYLSYLETGKDRLVPTLMSESNLRTSPLYPEMKELVDVMKYRSLSNKETIQIKQKELRKKIDQYTRLIVNDIKCRIRRDITDAEQKRLDGMFSYLIDDVQATDEAPYSKGMRIRGQLYPPTYSPVFIQFCKQLDSMFDLKVFEKNKSYYGEYLNLVYYSSEILKETIAEKKQKKVPSRFYEDSKKLDSLFSGKGKIYWASTCEMFARAGAAYLAIKGTDMGIRNDYLLGHAFDSVKLDDDKDSDDVAYIYPIGEEMEAFGKAFEKVIEKAKEIELFHDYSPIPTLRRESSIEMDQIVEKATKTSEVSRTGNETMNKVFKETSDEIQEEKEMYPIREEKDGQLAFNFDGR